MSERSKIHVPDWIRTLIPYPPGKPIEEVERQYGIRDSIKIASNENPLGPSPKAVAAIGGALGRLHRYPEGNCYYLRQGLAARLGVSEAQLIFGNGSNEIIELIVRTFVQPGEDTVMSDQAFVVYRLIVQAAGGRSRATPLREFTHDVDAIAAAITPHTRVVFLANPNNPTGTIFFQRDWERFLELVPPEVIIVMDEAYAEYVDDAQYPNSMAALEAGRRLVILRTFSKIYGLAGLRVGYGIAPAEIVDLLDRVRQPFNVNSLAQVGALAALSDDEHVARSRACNREGMTYLRRECERLGLDVVPSWANFLLIRVGDGARVYEALLRQGVIVRPVGVYGFPEHVRVTVGTAAENERFIAAVERVLND
jgi:histidinol-phosphate aminotransferase